MSTFYIYLFLLCCTSLIFSSNAFVYGKSYKVPNRINVRYEEGRECTRQKKDNCEFYAFGEITHLPVSPNDRTFYSFKTTDSKGEIDGEPFDAEVYGVISALYMPEVGNKPGVYYTSGLINNLTPTQDGSDWWNIEGQYHRMYLKRETTDSGKLAYQWIEVAVWGDEVLYPPSEKEEKEDETKTIL